MIIIENEVVLQIAKELTLKHMELYKIGTNYEAIFNELPSEYGKVFKVFYKAVMEAQN